MKPAIVLIIISILSLLSKCSDELKVDLHSPVVLNLVQSSQLVTVTTHCNPTTGYRWAYLPRGEDTQYVQLVGSNGNDFEFVADKHPEGMVGVGGQCVFRFKVKEQIDGNFSLRFVNGRPWEPEPVVEKTLSFTIQ